MKLSFPVADRIIVMSYGYLIGAEAAVIPETVIFTCTLIQIGMHEAVV